MMKSFSLLKSILVLFIGLCVFGACKRNDDEPIVQATGLSRLYVSYTNYQTNTILDPYRNLVIFSPADSATFTNAFVYDSGVKGGGAVHFRAAASAILFQGSSNGAGAVNDTTIQVMNISEFGIPGNVTNISNGILNRVRGLYYDSRIGKNNLYVTNSETPTSVYMFNSPLNFRGYTKPRQRISLGELRPWGLQFAGNDLLVSTNGDDKGVAFYKDITEKLDSVITDLAPTALLKVANAENISGFDYSESLDVLLMVDWSGADDGKIYIFENAKALLSQASGTITPTRVISGAATGLRNPIDVKIDNREGAGFVYVSDQLARKIFRFKLSDTGNATPSIAHEHRDRGVVLTPGSISLDARGSFNRAVL